MHSYLGSRVLSHCSQPRWPAESRQRRAKARRADAREDRLPGALPFARPWGRRSVVPDPSMAVRLPIPPQHNEEEYNAWGPCEHRSNQDSASALVKIISLKGCSTNLLSPKANHDCEENSYKADAVAGESQVTLGIPMSQNCTAPYLISPIRQTALSASCRR